MSLWIIGIILVAIVLLMVLKGKKGTVKPEPEVVSEPCGVFFWCQLFYNGVGLKNMEIVKIPLGKKVTFELKGFDINNKPACMDGTQITWADECGKQLFDSKTGSINTIKFDTIKTVRAIVHYRGLNTTSCRISSDVNYVEPVCGARNRLK